MIINDPSCLAEVEALFEAYEEALGANDLERLDAFFWHSSLAVRYGVGETLYGYEAIDAFRKARSGGSPAREIRCKVVTTFGSDFATTHIEFQRLGSTNIGRQSQVWVRMEPGWRVVAGHISLQADIS